jgi:hypothetical protein
METQIGQHTFHQHPQACDTCPKTSRDITEVRSRLEDGEWQYAHVCPSCMRAIKRGHNPS